jgi:putative transcriptional regulator
MDTGYRCKLKIIFAEKGIKHGEFAERIKIGQSALSKMVNNKTLPEFDTAYRIAEALDMRIEEIWKKD